MKAKANDREYLKNLRQRLMAALAMLLVAVILMVSTTMAWLVLSVAPEVTGIATNIGANGALEVALLNKDTYQNLSAIKTTTNQSLVSNKTLVNNTWGNLIDLSDKTYGLNELVLWPSRLNVVKKTEGDGYAINAGLLSVPEYAYDGRIMDLTDNTTTATYNNSKFSGTLGVQDYGVRAIGTSDTLSVQGSSLAIAKSQIPTYINSARNNAVSVLSDDIKELLTVLATALSSDNPTFDDADVKIVKNMITSLEASENYIEQTLRQGLVAIAAAKIGDEANFTTVRDRIADTSKSLSQILTEIKEFEIKDDFAEFSNWISKHYELEQKLESANAACNALTGGTYTRDQFMDVLSPLMDPDNVQLNESKLSELSKNDAMALLNNKNNTMIMGPGSGSFAIIADFTGNYSATISFAGSNIEVKTASTVNPAYLTILNEAVDKLGAADGGAEGETTFELGTTYGYAVDLAFRTNAQNSNLLLQTAGVQRINEESSSAGTMGNGSYMEFSLKELNLEDTLRLMDAVRVTFVGNNGDVFGIAKLNVTNRFTDESGMVKAPLYLYDYEISTEEETKGAIVMGERQKTNNTITALDRNLAKVVTAIVWLDGDIVDNTMVAAETETSLNGVLNLQFASSADLLPYSSAALMNYTPDKVGLATAIDDFKKTIVDKGQGTYTTVSWAGFMSAYNKAVTVNKNVNANDAQIYNALVNLNTEKENLDVIDPNVLKEKIDEVRVLTGTTTDKVYVILKKTQNDNDIYVKKDSDFTNEELKNNVGVVYRVDYNKNLNDEGNDIKTRIYTDESWSALASALYDAEATFLNKKATAVEIDAALLLLETSHKSLQRAVYYKPCEYNGQIYYFAISEETDTYGKWYDSSFKRIISDVTILELDAYAIKDFEIAEFDVDYLPSNQIATPGINILDEVYPELKDVNLIAAHWKLPEETKIAMTETQKIELQTLRAEYITLLQLTDEQLKTDALAIRALRLINVCPMEAYANAQSTIDELRTKIEEKRLELDEKPEDTKEPTITTNQKIVLAAAIASAKSVEGYDDDSNETLKTLKEKVKAADDALNSDKTTLSSAQTAIDGLNAELVKAGKTEVTEENTITYPLPEGNDTADILYAIDYPSFDLYIEDPTTRSVVFDAILLTDKGTIIKVKKNVDIYSPMGGIKIDDVTSAPIGGEMVKTKDEDGNEITTWNGVIVEGYGCYLDYSDFARKVRRRTATGELGFEEKDKLDEDGKPVVGTDGKTETVLVPAYDEIPHSEDIKEIEWSSSNTNVLHVSDDGYIFALEPGYANVYVTVKTKQGNEYSDYIHISVAQAYSIEITNAPAEISVGETFELNLEIRRFCTSIEGSLYSPGWSSSDPDVIKVSNDDKITGVAPGTAKITYEATAERNNKTYGDTVTITVK